MKKLKIFFLLNDPMNTNTVIPTPSVTTSLLCLVCGLDQPQALLVEHIETHSLEHRFAGRETLLLLTLTLAIQRLSSKLDDQVIAVDMKHHLVVCELCDSTIPNVEKHITKKHPKASSSDLNVAKMMDILYPISSFALPAQPSVLPLSPIIGLKVQKRHLCPRCGVSTSDASFQKCHKECGKQQLVQAFMQKVRAPSNMMIYKWRVVNHEETEAAPTAITDLAVFLSGRIPAAPTAANQISYTNAFFTTRYSGTNSFLGLTFLGWILASSKIEDDDFKMLGLLCELPSRLLINPPDAFAELEECQGLMVDLEHAAGKFWDDSVSFSLHTYTLVFNDTENQLSIP